MEGLMIALLDGAFNIFDNEGTQAEWSGADNRYIPAADLQVAEVDLEQFDYMGIKPEHLGNYHDFAQQVSPEDYAKLFASIEKIVASGRFWDYDPADNFMPASHYTSKPVYQPELSKDELWHRLSSMSAADILAGHDDMVEQQPSMEIKVPFKVYNRQEQIVVEASIPEGFWQQFNWKEEFTVNNVLAFTQRINFNELKMNYNNGRLKVEIPQQKVFKHK